MKESEKAAKAKLKSHGVQTTKQGSATGHTNDKNWEADYSSPTTLKHGIISRMMGRPPREVK